MVATNQLNKLSNEQYGSNSIVFSPPMGGNLNYVSYGYGQGGMSSFNDSGAVAVDAEHIVQITLSDGMSASWPFGLSILETIYKVYKQKELLEDAILIYRIHRAPERRVFFIDVGTMPPNKAAQYLERIKYEVQQKRIPSRTGGGGNVTDSTYNPLCLDLSTRIPLLDSRTLPLSEIIDEFNDGKENWAYSCDPITGKIVPGIISWAGITRKDAKVIKITLDNGETIISTPDHKIPVLGKGFVEAQNLTVNDSLISFQTQYKSLSNDPNRSYQQVYDHEKNKWVPIYEMASDLLSNELANTIVSSIESRTYGHYDFDSVYEKSKNYDNRIKSIEYLNDTMDVGTITIDGNEIYHNYHTFALESGIFVKNSTMEDYYFAQSADRPW